MLLCVSHTASATSPEQFMAKNPKAARTIKTPDLVARCIAGNMILEDSNVKGADKINTLIVALSDTYNGKNIILVERLTDQFYSVMSANIKLWEAHWQQGGCKNLNESLVQTFPDFVAS